MMFCSIRGYLCYVSVCMYVNSEWILHDGNKRVVNVVSVQWTDSWLEERRGERPPCLIFTPNFLVMVYP